MKVRLLACLTASIPTNYSDGGLGIDSVWRIRSSILKKWERKAIVPHRLRRLDQRFRTPHNIPTFVNALFLLSCTRLISCLCHTHLTRSARTDICISHLSHVHLFSGQNQFVLPPLRVNPIPPLPLPSGPLGFRRVASSTGVDLPESVFCASFLCTTIESGLAL